MAETPAAIWLSWVCQPCGHVSHPVRVTTDKAPALYWEAFTFLVCPRCGQMVTKIATEWVGYEAADGSKHDFRHGGVVPTWGQKTAGL